MIPFLSINLTYLRANLLLCSISLFFTNSLYSQIHCGLVEIEPNTSINNSITFDSFQRYQGGYTINSAARIRVKVEDKSTPDPLCSWSLRMIVDNNSVSGTPIDEWEELYLYGLGNSSNPTIDALEIRVRNECSTSPIDGVFTNFNNDQDLIEIIAPLLPITPAGSCTLNVNGPGSYQTNYNEFNFNIDIRVKPNFTFNPGLFELNIKFILEENP